jgi:5'-3' exonuclease
VEQAYAEGYEADDVASALVKVFHKDRILLDSNDHDWWLMLSDRVDIFQDNNVRTKGLVEGETGICLDSYLLYKAITGDKSDNIQGIRRVKKKVLESLLNGYGNDVDEFLFRCQKAGEIVFLEEANIDLVHRNIKLCSLVDTGYRIQYIPVSLDTPRLIEILESYDMKSLVIKIK